MCFAERLVNFFSPSISLCHRKKNVYSYLEHHENQSKISQRAAILVELLLIICVDYHCVHFSVRKKAHRRLKQAIENNENVTNE